MLSVDGTSLAASTDIHGNHTAVQTQWQEGKMAELLEQEVYLRFNLRQTQLYSYWFG